MPPRSKAQARAMGAAAGGKSTKGIPQRVGREFTRGTTKAQVAKLPERKRQRGSTRKR